MSTVEQLDEVHVFHDDSAGGWTWLRYRHGDINGIIDRGIDVYPYPSRAVDDAEASNAEPFVLRVDMRGRVLVVTR